jgi:predicted amidophosphoribosyltransferase
VRLLSLIAPPLCAACGGPAAAAALCPSCSGALDRLGSARVVVAGLEVWAPVAYAGSARTVVRRVKFHGAAALAGYMAATIVANAPAGLLDAPLVAVPSPPARRRRRGFCHATLLAQALAARTELPLLRLLERVDSRRQVGRARRQRLRSPPRFGALGPGSGEVVLVDDVVTTGATLGACAQALRDKGWHCGRAVAYARTPVR